MIALADVKPGDPDPTDPTVPDEDRCPEFWWAKVRHLVLCSRADGHDGPHIAGDGATVLAVWR